MNRAVHSQGEPDAIRFLFYTAHSVMFFFGQPVR